MSAQGFQNTGHWPIAHRRIKAGATTGKAKDTRTADQFDNLIRALHLLAGGPRLSMQPHPHLHLILAQPAHTDRQLYIGTSIQTETCRQTYTNKQTYTEPALCICFDSV